MVRPSLLRTDVERNSDYCTMMEELSPCVRGVSLFLSCSPTLDVSLIQIPYSPQREATFCSILRPHEAYGSSGHWESV